LEKKKLRVPLLTSSVAAAPAAIDDDVQNGTTLMHKIRFSSTPNKQSFLIFRLIDRPRRFDKGRECQSANRAVEFNFSRKAANVGRCYCSGRSLFGSLMEKWNFRNEKNSCDVAGCPISQPLITLETRFS
jgi:hypothetical protein